MATCWSISPSPAALRQSLDRAIAAGIPILVGTTGLDDLADQRIADAAEQVAVLRAANTSLGVALLADLVERAARVLGADAWDIEIVEAHHASKVDAPSGTALHARRRRRARARRQCQARDRGRDGTGSAREPGAIGYAAVRGGTVAGDHDVMFLGAERAADPVAPRRKPRDLRRAARSPPRASSTASRPASTPCAT